MLILTEEKGSRHLNSICFLIILYIYTRFPGGSAGKESACNAGDQGSIPGSGRSPGEEHGNPLQYACLENSRDKGAWWLQSMGSQSRTRLSDNHSSLVCYIRIIFHIGSSYLLRLLCSILCALEINAFFFLKSLQTGLQHFCEELPPPRTSHHTLSSSYC